MSTRFALIFFGSIALAVATASGAPSDGWQLPEFGPVERFATLPARSSPTGVAEGHPEGLCADSQGNIYADSFEQPTSTGYVLNYIYTFRHDGKLLTATPLPISTSFSPVPLGCAAKGNKLYVNDVYGGNELEYSLPLNDSSLPDRTFPICGGFIGNPGLTCGLNANYVGPDGRVYMSDNGAGLFGDFVGRIWVLDPETGTSGIFIDPPQIAVANLPVADYVPTGTVLPYSANGIAFSRDGSALYIANMSTNIIYKQKVNHCNSIVGCEPEGQIVQFSNDPHHLIQGPDNIDFDNNGNLWIASGQDQHVIGLDCRGDIIGVFGQFFGFDKEGAPLGLLQPSGVIFSKGNIYVGNESSQSLLPAADNVNWSAQKLFTISVFDPDQRW